MIEIKKLYKDFGRKRVLKDINLKFESGNVYGIVGENGAGKTTLFRCIADLEDYEGEVISTLNPLKDYTGFLMTEPFFFNKMTGTEYIRLLCNARQKQVSRISDKNIFDLPLNQYVSTYSSGMKKKLAFLAILLQGNQCFVLDEPFNGVDIHSNIMLVDIIRELKSLNKHVLLSSHIFSTLSDTCDEIYLLKEGEIIKKVLKGDFDKLESEMKEFAVGSKIERLGLS
jgi:ABC-2 type transport system ATP-binding protein